MIFLEPFGINIKDEVLLNNALTHSSYANEHNEKSYERLEFLGDAVLQILMSEYLYLHTDLNEGEMSKVRASFVCEAALAEYSRDLGVVPYIKVGAGQAKDINDTIIADIFESVIGAIYLSSGIESVRKIFDNIIIPYVKNDHPFLKDYKSLLQEMIQTDKKALEYRIIDETGPAHDKEFIVEVVIDNIVFGRGMGKSKKEAEQKAALDAYRKSVS